MLRAVRARAESVSSVTADVRNQIATKEEVASLLLLEYYPKWISYDATVKLKAQNLHS